MFFVSEVKIIQHSAIAIALVTASSPFGCISFSLSTIPWQVIGTPVQPLNYKPQFN